MAKRYTNPNPCRRCNDTRVAPLRNSNGIVVGQSWCPDCACPSCHGKGGWFESGEGAMAPDWWMQCRICEGTARKPSPEPINFEALEFEAFLKGL